MQAQGQPPSFPRQHATTRRFTLGAPRNFSVTADGETVVFLRSKAGDDPTLCLWAFDVATGTERLVADPATFGDDGSDLSAAERARRERARESAEGIVAYSIDRAGKRIAFTVNGGLHVVDPASGHRVVLPTTGSVFDPVIDPTGQRVAYVSESGPADDPAWSPGLWHVAADGSEQPVLAGGDPSPLVSWGRAEFIAAEEMGRSRGVWWSPDGRHLLAERVDEEPVDRWWIADPANPDREPTEVRYPAAGTTNASVTLMLVSIDDAGREPVPVPWATVATEYLADVIWAEGHDPLIVRQSRDQRTVELVEFVGLTDPTPAPAPTPTVRRTITDDTWVELIPGSPRWLGDHLLTVEDTATNRALCLDGRPVTGDDVQVRSIVGLRSGNAGDDVLITASLDDPAEVLTMAVSVDPTSAGAATLLDGTPGVHTLRHGGGTTVTVSANATEPGSRCTVRTSGGDVVGTIENRSATPLVTAAPLFFSAGPRALRSALFLPTGTTVDSALAPASLPILMDPYGGPHAQRVLKNHNSHLVSQWFADQGFAVIVTDGAGTPGRGPRFEREVWGDLAGPVLDDQIAAIDHAVATWPFLDHERVGIRGWSFGGYLAALAVLRRPDRFHAAVAGAPVTTWNLYDTHYTERYLGHPDAHPEHYETSDLLVEVERAEGKPNQPLLLIHGLADDNVVAAHTLRLSSILLAAGRAHTVLPLSGVTHMTPQEVVAENLLLLQKDFLAASLNRNDGADSPGA